MMFIRRIILLLLCLLLIGSLSGCAGKNIEVRPRGKIDVGFGVGSR